MGELKVGFNEGNFHNVYPLYLKDIMIGDVTINKNNNKKVFIVYDIHISEEYRGNYYFPQFLNILEEKAKDEGFDFILLQWINIDKMDSLKNKRFRELSSQEKHNLTNLEKNKMYMIKDLR